MLRRWRGQDQQPLDEIDQAQRAITQTDQRRTLRLGRLEQQVELGPDRREWRAKLVCGIGGEAMGVAEESALSYLGIK